MMFLVNSFVTPILWTFSPSLILKQIQIWFIERREKKDMNNPDIIKEEGAEECKTHGRTQRELNELFELPPMNIAAKYSYLAKTLLMTFLYIPIFPLGVGITMVGLIFGYFLEKLNFSRFYKKPEMLNKQLCQFYTGYFVVNLFVYSIGDYIFLNKAYNSRLWSLINIIFFGVMIIVPYYKIFGIDCIGLEESKVNKEELKDVYFKFYNDYERANPMTKREGTINYLKKLLENGTILQSDYDNLVANINHVNLLEIYYNTRQEYEKFKYQKELANRANNKKKFGGNFGKKNRRKIFGKNKKKRANNNENNNDNSSQQKELKKLDEVIRNDENDDDEDKKNEIVDEYNNPLLLNMGYLVGAIGNDSNKDGEDDQKNKESKNNNKAMVVIPEVEKENK